MKLEAARVRRGSRVLTGYLVSSGNSRVFVTGTGAGRTARGLLERYRAKPGAFGKFVQAVRRYRVFNNESPRRVLNRKLVITDPLIRIGKMPEITYLSRKEGKPAAYVHRTKKMPTLFWDEKNRVGLIVGGSLKVRDWLYN